MRMNYYTREGRFNIIDPSQVSLSCNVRVYDDEGKTLKVCNFTPEWAIYGSDPEDVTIEIERSLKSYWSTSKDRQEMLEFLKENENEINVGNWQHELTRINQDIEGLQARKKQLEKFLERRES